MLILSRQLYRFTRFLHTGPTLTMNSTLRANRFRALALLSSFSGNQHFQRAIIHAHIRPNRTTTRHLCFRLLFDRRRLIRHHSFRFSTKQELSNQYRIRRPIKMRMRSRRNVITLKILQFFFSTRTITLFIRLNRAMTFKIIRPVTRRDNITIILNVNRNFTRRANRTQAIRSIITRRRTNAVITSGLASSGRDLHRAIKQKLFNVFRICTRIATIPRRTARTK